MSGVLRLLCTICLLITFAGCGKDSSSGKPSPNDSSSGGKYLMGGSIQGRAVPVTGVVTTLTPTGAAAVFNQPFGITTDGANLYVADYRNGIIRKIVIATGAVSTIGLETHFVAPTGITTDGTHLYVLDTGVRRILKVEIATGLVGWQDSTGADFYMPYGITTDGTNLYVADTGNHAIKKVVIATGEVTTLSGPENFNSPYGITTDGTNLYVADTGNNVIKKVAIATGEVASLAGAENFSGPYGITTDGTNLYVADTGNNVIKKVVIATGEVTVLAGSPPPAPPGSNNGTGAMASFNGPYGITTDGANLYVADAGNNAIRMVQ